MHISRYLSSLMSYLFNIPCRYFGKDDLELSILDLCFLFLASLLAVSAFLFAVFLSVFHCIRRDDDRLIECL